MCARAGEQERAQQAAERRRVRLLGQRGRLRSLRCCRGGCCVSGCVSQQWFRFTGRSCAHTLTCRRARAAQRPLRSPLLPSPLPRALDEPDLKVRVAPVVVAPARRVGAAAVRGALLAVAVGAGRTVVADGEVTTTAKDWPVGWDGPLVAAVIPGDGFVALGLAGAQPVEVVAAGGAVVAGGAAAVIPLDSAAPFLGPAPLRLGTNAHTQRRPAHRKSHGGSAPHGRASAAHKAALL
eukprot:COSAG06_NODE_84_length_25090_cov_20.561042_10_plen_237_part_00